MKMYTEAQYNRLLRNGSRAHHHEDHVPVVKWVRPDTGEIYLLTRLDPEHPSLAFGLCDPDIRRKQTFPQCFWMPDVWFTAERKGFAVRRDCHFKAVYPISVYARAARRAGRITCDPEALARAESALRGEPR